jgi:hypothetical protein
MDPVNITLLKQAVQNSDCYLGSCFSTFKGMIVIKSECVHWLISMCENQFNVFSFSARPIGNFSNG